MPSVGPVIGGAAQGAAAGVIVAGPIGAVVGGVLGAVGGIFASKSASQARLARKKRQQITLISNFLERRRLLQTYAQARSATLALGLASGAGAKSSGIQGSMGSLYEQTRSNLAQNAEQVYLGRQAFKLDSKAETNAANANAVMNVVQAAPQLAAAIPQSIGYSASAQRMGTGSYQYGNYSSPLSAPPLPTINSSPFTTG